MLRAEGNHNGVIGGRCLQLEIERTAKTFSQCESPGTIDSVAERRVQDKLHPARFIEETQLVLHAPFGNRINRA